MTADASTNACASKPGESDLRFDRTHALVAMHAARHQTCPAYGPLRNLLVNVLLTDGYSRPDANRHADDLIDVARGVIDSIDAGEPRTVPWPGGLQMQPYVQTMYEMETSK